MVLEISWCDLVDLLIGIHLRFRLRFIFFIEKMTSNFTALRGRDEFGNEFVADAFQMEWTAGMERTA